QVRNNNLLNRFCGGILCSNGFDSSNYGEGSDENVELLGDKNLDGEDGQQHMGFLEKKRVEEKHKKQNFRKPPKPPRPP
ncbi:hypothetical protein, partial [Vibrio vulnificus]|uniref:hypothetical protein n=1 Tax=Vibrio vulnificus TaxID=672 RepID=UPI0019D4764C